MTAGVIAFGLSVAACAGWFGYLVGSWLTSRRIFRMLEERTVRRLCP